MCYNTTAVGGYQPSVSDEPAAGDETAAVCTAGDEPVFSPVLEGHRRTMNNDKSLTVSPTKHDDTLSASRSSIPLKQNMLI